MTALAGGGYDERFLDDEMKCYGWEIDGNETICPDCVEARKEQEETEAAATE